MEIFIVIIIVIGIILFISVRSRLHKSTLLEKVLPQKTSNEQEWLDLADAVLRNNNIISIVRTCFAFTYQYPTESDPREGIVFLEYAGDINDVKEFINNQELLNYLNYVCSDWKQYLANVKSANQLIVTRILWDNWGNIIGIMALWWDYDDFPKIKGLDFIPFVIMHGTIPQLKLFGKKTSFNESPYKYVDRPKNSDCYEFINKKWVLTGKYNKQTDEMLFIHQTAHTKERLQYLKLLEQRKKLIEDIVLNDGNIIFTILPGVPFSV